MGTCKVDGLYCDGAWLVCRLNASETNPTYYVDGEKRDFWNKECSNYTKEEKI